MLAVMAIVGNPLVHMPTQNDGHSFGVKPSDPGQPDPVIHRPNTQNVINTAKTIAMHSTFHGALSLTGSSLSFISLPYPMDRP